MKKKKNTKPVFYSWETKTRKCKIFSKVYFEIISWSITSFLEQSKTTATYANDHRTIDRSQFVDSVF